MDLMQQIQESIEAGHPQETGDLVARGLEEGTEPSLIVDGAMVPAMKRMGEFFKNGDSDIPKILAAARCVRQGFDIIEKTQTGYDQGQKGTVILGTVEGDLHDVGKNLVALMFRSKGFRVIDLGVDISGNQFQKALREHPEASLVCISSLLNTSLPQMSRIVRQLRQDPKRKYKIMLGGGAVSEELARQMGADAYTETAADAAEAAEELLRTQKGNLA